MADNDEHVSAVIGLVPATDFLPDCVKKEEISAPKCESDAEFSGFNTALPEERLSNSLNHNGGIAVKVGGSATTGSSSPDFAAPAIIYSTSEQDEGNCLEEDPLSLVAITGTEDSSRITPASTPATTTRLHRLPKYIATPSPPSRRRRLDSTSSASSSSDYTLPKHGRKSKRRGNGRGGRAPGRGRQRGRRMVGAQNHKASFPDPDSPQPSMLHELSPSPPSSRDASPPPCHDSPPPPTHQGAPSAPKPHQGKLDAFVWTEFDEILPNIPNFDNRELGIQAEFPCSSSSPVMDYFTAFFDLVIMTQIMNETNKYRQDMCKFGDMSQSKMANWTDVTVAEMYVWLALTLLMSHVKKHRLRDYWSLDDLVCTPVFRKYMSRDRYHSILHSIHFASNMCPNPNDGLWKLQPVMSKVLENIRTFFRPFQKVVIDKSVVVFRGRLAFIQYIPSKARLGINFYVVCDCRTGYILDFVVYPGRDVDNTRNNPYGFSESAVKNLVDHYFVGNYILYTDKYYISPVISKYLLENQTVSCNTATVHAKKRERGVCKKRGDMLAIQWDDKRLTSVPTTVSSSQKQDSGEVTCGTGKSTLKPDAILDCNVNMKLLDKADLMISSVNCLRRSCKWYRKIFLHLLDIAMLNSHILYQQLHVGHQLNLREFEKEVIRQLLEKYGTVRPQQYREPVSQQPDRFEAHGWLRRHYLTLLPKVPSGRPGYRRCFVCKHTTRRNPRKETRYWCNQCRVPLCPTECFRDYHTAEQI